MVGRWLSGGRTRLEGRHVVGVEQRPLDSALRAIRVKAWRLHLETPGVVATVPMLRGVWGAALRAESEACYCRLFEGAESERPRYLMRPAPRWLSPRPPSSSCCFPRRQTCSTTGTTRRSPGLLGTGPAGRGWGLIATPSASVPSCLWRGMARRSSRLRRQPGFVAGRPALAGRNRGNAVPARIPRPAQAAATRAS